MGVVLLADLGEELEAGAAVAVAVLHADLGEHAGHVLGADAPVDGGHRAVAGPKGSSWPTSSLRRPAGQQPGPGELLHAEGQAHVGLARP